MSQDLVSIAKRMAKLQPRRRHTFCAELDQMAKDQIMEAGLGEPIVCALKRARNLESLP
jgi:hypothetical protein